MRADELDFHLPPDLIAQSPSPDRAQSRLLHYRRHDRSIAHRHFADLPSLLRPGDLLVFNNARVIPARFSLHKPTGGHVEALYLAESSRGVWRVLLKNMGPSPIGKQLHFTDAPDLSAQVIAKNEEGEYLLNVDTQLPALTLLDRLGRMPLPPYIHRDKRHDPRDDADRDRYQTVFATEPGSIAAPTAGLHFTPALLAQLTAAGIHHTALTLHVGLGTFKPVTAPTLAQHRMHTESYTLPQAAADALNLAKAENRRIIPVGTTATRVLESQPPGKPFAPTQSETNIFIHPPYPFRHISALITNFHLPRSTLIALVAALTGLDEQRRLYATAIQHRYRFFSYGDAMLIE